MIDILALRARTPRTQTTSLLIRLAIQTTKMRRELQKRVRSECKQGDVKDLPMIALVILTATLASSFRVRRPGDRIHEMIQEKDVSIALQFSQHVGGQTEKGRAGDSRIRG